MENYVIINKTDILKRIEELEENKLNVLLGSDIEIRVLEQILSQSTPLITVLEDAFNAGSERGEYGYGNANYKQDYISNLKLEI